MNRIQKVIKVGDLIYPTQGKPKRIDGVYQTGFISGKRFFFYSEHRKKYFLTEAGLRAAKAGMAV